jgi:xylulokinase
MLSDVLDMPLRTVAPSEGAPLGAAMLAAVATGEFSDVVAAGNLWLTDLDAVAPDALTRGAYDDAYRRYRALYLALREMFASRVE